MLVYRSAARTGTTARLLDRLAAALGAAADEAGDPHARWVELLIDAGELEAAAVDALCPEADDDTPATRALRALTLAAGRTAERSWAARRDGESSLGTAAAAAHGRELRDALAAVRDLGPAALRTEVTIGVPEGYAYYGLYPETYAEAARRLGAERRPARVVCIGVRSIGTSLSAMAAAALTAGGAEVASYTVRPRGHPFDRRVELAPALRRALAAHAAAGATFVIADEGPGLSGSSFAGTAEAVASLGVDDERIVLLPSWLPDPSAFRSVRARERWPRHAKYVVPFEELLGGDDGPLARRAESLGGAAEDVSGGAWRAQAYVDDRDWPAVQPQHERRKYLVRRADGAPVALLKFAGLGRYGRAAYGRAERLGAAGLSPRTLGLADGFAATEWVAGEPAHEGDADDALVRAAARHVAHLARHEPSDRAVPWDELLDVVRVNAAGALGSDGAERLAAALAPFERPARAARTCAVDGRMMPHEWVRGAGGWLKTDAADHHDDHFLTGDQDAAWDLAGAAVELLLGPARERALLDAYVRESGDANVAARLPFYRVAYLALRLGYVTLGADALGDAGPPPSDAGRLRALGRRYAATLRREAARLGAVPRLALPDAWAAARLVIFDADGTLRRTTVAGQPCPHASHEWELLPWAAAGALAALPWGEPGGLSLGIASNQDHVGYGHMGERAARALLTSMAVEATGHVPDAGAVALCPHVLEEPCACRKPGDGMLRALLRHHGVPAAAALFVGDADSDREAARRAGVPFAYAHDFFERLGAAAPAAASAA